MIAKVTFGLVSLGVFVSSLAFGSTGAGNGGDVMDRFLGATRTSLIEVLSFIKQGVDAETVCQCKADTPQDIYCAELKGLTAPQRELCQDFVTQTSEAVLYLNRKDPATAFRLTNRELFVNDALGEMRPVSAITDLGPEGDILFNYDRVETLSPMGILALISHEFGHKVQYQNRYVTDNEAVGAFDFLGGGRKLMDAVGAAVATYAADHGKIGKYFSLEDRFSCRIFLGSGHGFVAKGASPRLFTGKHGSYRSYETGLGNSPQDFQCSTLENFGATKLSLQLKIHEDLGCEKKERISAPQRATQMRLIRENVEDSSESVVLKEEKWVGFNPLCEENFDQSLIMEYEESGKSYRFETKYLGSVGKTDGYIRNRK